MRKYGRRGRKSKRSFKPKKRFTKGQYKSYGSSRGGIRL